jgi:hypothetical protein
MSLHFSFYVVANSDLTILSVFGSSLIVQALDSSMKIEEKTGIAPDVYFFTGHTRPRVGQTLMGSFYKLGSR